MSPKERLWSIPNILIIRTISQRSSGGYARAPSFRSRTDQLWEVLGTTVGRSDLQEVHPKRIKEEESCNFYSGTSARNILRGKGYQGDSDRDGIDGVWQRRSPHPLDTTHTQTLAYAKEHLGRLNLCVRLQAKPHSMGPIQTIYHMTRDTLLNHIHALPTPPPPIHATNFSSSQNNRCKGWERGRDIEHKFFPTHCLNVWIVECTRFTCVIVSSLSIYI